MGLFGAIGKSGPRAAGIPRRAERYQTSGLSCPLGEVADLSGAGMRVRCNGRPPAAKGDVRQFILTSGAQKLEVTGRVVWVRRTSWSGFGVGIHFLNVKPALVAALVQLARFNFVGRKGGAAAGRAPQPSAAMEVEDLYRILGVAPEASQDQIQAAYRAKALAVHPDVCKGEQSGAQFALISKAYSVLRDADQRRRYDLLLAGCE